MSILAAIPPISRRATIVDIARLADVSTATVDRVLNGRQGVKEATVKRVMKAAAELGYVDESDERMNESGMCALSRRSLSFFLKAPTATSPCSVA
jgi:LacI family transcriptional regulator